MTVDELAVLDGSKCILQLRGVRPFLSDKYDLTKHPNYEYTADADNKNWFDIENTWIGSWSFEKELSISLLRFREALIVNNTTLDL